jgi:death-on-curing protein
VTYSTRDTIEYLTVAEVELMHQEYMTGAGFPSVLRDAHALESAVLRPRNAAYYNGADLCTQAASLIAGIALAHAFEDGNKRLAYAAGATLLRINGVRIAADPVTFGDQVLGMVNRDVKLDRAIQQLALWLQQHTEPASPAPLSP